jgi:hypothetical protein
MRSAVFVAGLAFTFACSSEPTPPDPGPTTLVAQLHVDPKQATAGTSMTITLTITHTGRGSTRFSVLKDGRSFKPFVRTSAGTTVWVGNAGPTSNQYEEVTLTHGDVFTTSVVWMLNESTGGPLAPGTYVLESNLDAAEDIQALCRIETPITISPPSS